MDPIYHIHGFMEPFCTPEAANNMGDGGSCTKGQHMAVNLEQLNTGINSQQYFQIFRAVTSQLPCKEISV